MRWVMVRVFRYRAPASTHTASGPGRPRAVRRRGRRDGRRSAAWRPSWQGIAKLTAMPDVTSVHTVWCGYYATDRRNEGSSNHLHRGGHRGTTRLARSSRNVGNHGNQTVPIAEVRRRDEALTNPSMRSRQGQAGCSPGSSEVSGGTTLFLGRRGPQSAAAPGLDDLAGDRDGAGQQQPRIGLCCSNRRRPGRRAPRRG